MQKTHDCSFDLAQLMLSNLNYFCHRLSILNSNDSYAKRIPTVLWIKEETLILSSCCPLCHVWTSPEPETGNTLVWVVGEATQTEKGAGLFHSGLNHRAQTSLLI